MRKIGSFFTLVSAFLLVVGCSFDAHASSSQQQKAQVIAVVDLRRVASDSKAGKGIEAQVVKLNNSSKKELIDLEAKIKSMEANKTSASDPRKIEDLQLILYDMVKERRSQIAEAYERAISALETVIKNAIKEIANEKGVDVILAADAIIFSGNNCKDITPETIKRVDQICDYIDLVISSEKKND